MTLNFKLAANVNEFFFLISRSTTQNRKQEQVSMNAIAVYNLHF